MINRLLITALLLCLLPAAAAFGQELRQEQLKGTDGAKAVGYAVFYSNGMPESAIWPLGMKLRAKAEDGGSTIRHTESKGNSDGTIENIAVNDKVPYRFIIAPTNGDDSNWTDAMGLTSESASGNLDPVGTAQKSGCATYTTFQYSSGWRMPTQREMMLMWLFKDAINAIYSGSWLINTQYWTATEKENASDKAWFMDFTTNEPQMNFETKASRKKVRCVRDY